MSPEGQATNIPQSSSYKLQRIPAEYGQETEDSLHPAPLIGQWLHLRSRRTGILGLDHPHHRSLKGRGFTTEMRTEGTRGYHPLPRSLLIKQERHSDRTGSVSLTSAQSRGLEILPGERQSIRTESSKDLSK